MKSAKYLPGTQISPSSYISALMVLIMEISPSVAERDKVSFFALSLMHSRTGTVVLVEHAFTTFKTASDKSIPSHMNFSFRLV